MKLLLAALTFFLVAGQSLAQPPKAAFGAVAVAGGPKIGDVAGVAGAAGAPTTAQITVNPPNFEAGLRPGARVNWTVTVHFPARPSALLINQTGSNLSLSQPQVRCSANQCPKIPSGLQGAIAYVQFPPMPPGAYATIVGTATIAATGPYSVTVDQTLSQMIDQPTRTVATIPGVAIAASPPSNGWFPPIPFPWNNPGGAVKPPSRPVNPPTGVAYPPQTKPPPQNPPVAAPTAPTNVAPPPAATKPTPPKRPRPKPRPKPIPTPADGITVSPDLSPGPYQVGQTVTATFTFINESGRTLPLEIVDDTPSNLQVTDYGGDCKSIPCPLVELAPGQSYTASIHAVVAEPRSALPDAFEESISYRVGETAAQASVSGIPEPSSGTSIRTWLEIAAGVLAAAAIAALGVNHLRWRWWNDHIVVRAESHADTAAGKPEKIGEYVVAHVEGGAAAPRGPIPVIRIDPNGR